MKTILIIGVLSAMTVACSDSKTEIAEEARQKAIDSMQTISNLEMTRQRTIDSMNLINAQNQVIVNPVETESITIQHPASVHHATHPVSHQPGAGTASTNNGTVVNSGVANTNTAPAAADNTSVAVTPEEKKKMSGKTKGALIGAGAGAVIGAIGGAIINKNDPAKGAAIGGILGGAVGSGVGYGAGNAKDKKAANTSTTTTTTTPNP